MISVADLLPWRHVPPLPSRRQPPGDGKPDLLLESEHRAAVAEAAAARELAAFAGMRVYPPVKDPRDPDRLVFEPPGVMQGGAWPDLVQRRGPCGTEWGWYSSERACWNCGAVPAGAP